MNNQQTTIQNLLSDWGKYQSVSNYNSDIKNLVLNSLPQESMVSIKPSRFSFTRISLATGGALLILLVVFASSKQQSTLVNQFADNVPMSSTGARMSESRGGLLDSAMNSIESVVNPTTLREPDLYQPYPDIPVSDSREFMKMSYNATITTRKAQATANRVQTVIKGSDGRIDNANISAKYGVITFVIPASKLDEFRSEISQIAGSRFIDERTSSQNLLNQKQGIEKSLSTAQLELNDVLARREKAISLHNSAVSSIETNLKVNWSKLASLQAQWTKYPEQRSQIEAQTREAEKERANLNSQLKTENDNYQLELSSLDKEVRIAQSKVDEAQEQDSDFLDNIETVQGTIVIQGINIWQIIGYYWPYWPLYLIGLVLIILFWLRHQRNSKFIIN